MKIEERQHTYKLMKECYYLLFKIIKTPCPISSSGPKIK